MQKFEVVDVGMKNLFQDELKLVLHHFYSIRDGRLAANVSEHDLLEFQICYNVLLDFHKSTQKKLEMEVVENLVTKLSFVDERPSF